MPPSNRETKQNVLNTSSMKILRLFLMSIGAWPGEALGERLPVNLYLRKHVVVQTFAALFGEMYFLIRNFRILPFFDLGHMYITNFLTALTFARVLLPNFKRYRIISDRFLNKFHLIHFRHQGRYYEEMYNKISKVSFYFALYLMSIMMFGLILFNLSPMYNNYKMGLFSNSIQDNATLEFSVYYSFPSFKPLKRFYACTLYNYILSFVCAVSVCGMDLYLSMMVFQVIGHIEILRYNLENMERPKKKRLCMIRNIGVMLDIYDINENKSVNIMLNQCTDHHRFIVSVTDEMSDFFGPTLAFYYLFHLVSGCLLLLECSRGDPDALARYLPLTIIIFGQLMQISIVFEVVGHVSEKLIDSVYLVPWECMNVENQKKVCFILNRVQRTIHVTAMGITPVGVQTMAGILKTSFSYFMFLRTMDV
nr:odorant receptor OR44 [Phauda flammans]